RSEAVAQGGGREISGKLIGPARSFKKSAPIPTDGRAFVLSLLRFSGIPVAVQSSLAGRIRLVTITGEVIKRQYSCLFRSLPTELLIETFTLTIGIMYTTLPCTKDALRLTLRRLRCKSETSCARKLLVLQRFE